MTIAVPTKVTERIKVGLKKLRPVLVAAKERDINESDTALIVASILAEVLGYDRFLEITSEFCIRGTYCDLAVKLDGKPKILIEVKAIGLDLKDTHVRQAVDYGANQGIEWVVLTNGVIWRAYSVVFKKPIDHELVFEVNIIEDDVRASALLERLYTLSREGLQKQALIGYQEERQATSRFMVAAILQSEPVTDVIRREIRRVSGGVRIEAEELCEILRNEVIKRDALEGAQATTAGDRVRRRASRALRATTTDGTAQVASTNTKVGEQSQPQSVKA
jgi:hypothetical protein